MVIKFDNVKQYFPDYPEGKLPDRQYFFKILSNTMPQWLESQIKHAQKARFDVVDETKVRNTVEMWEKNLKEIEETAARGSKKHRLIFF